MTRVIIVLACTFVFALLGLFIGHLTVQASTPPPQTGRAVHDDVLMLGYLFAPVIGVVVGFALSSVTIWLFGSKQSG